MKKQRQFQLKVAIVLTIFIFGAFVFSQMFMDTGAPTPGAAIPHGYDGVVSELSTIEHSYSNVHELPSDIYYGGIDPRIEWDGLIYSNPVGLKCTITAPQFIMEDRKSPLVYEDDSVYISGERYIKKATLERSIVSFEMSSTVKTVVGYDDYGDDAQKIEDVKFWVTLKNSDFSIFTDADEVAVAILSVRTLSVNKVQQGEDLELFPDAGGQDLPLHTVQTGVEISGLDIPKSADIQIDNFNALRNVRFPIHVLTADPINPTLFTGRVDCQVDIQFVIEVLLLGQWIEYRPYQEYVPPAPELTWLEQVVEAFTDFVGGIGEWLSNPFNLIILVVIVVAIAMVIMSVAGIGLGARPSISV